MNKFYITTAIAYTNSKPHIGYALELVQADILARCYRQESADVYFLTGTDDHGVKIYESAQENKTDTKKFVDKNIIKFRELANKLNISNDNFISTSDKKNHWPGAVKLWKKLAEAGDIYKKKYKGLYCVGCEAFLTQKDLVDGKCPNHQKEPRVIEEENYFFKLTKYKKQIKKLIEEDKFKIIPVERKNEVLKTIDEIDDVSFSRPKDKLPWGIPVPGDESQVMYVWCDALSNYISGIGYGQKNQEKFDAFWPADVHVVGKDILKFHAIYWPAMLLSAKLELPKNIFVHGFITSEGKKMSKSLGNVVDPVEIINRYDSDALRYYLLREISPTKDGDFSKEKFIGLYNSDLANNLGNLVNRIIVLSNKFGLKYKPTASRELFIRIAKHIKKFEFGLATSELNLALNDINKEVEQAKPWQMKEDEAKGFLKTKLDELADVNEILKVILPDTAKKIEKIIKSGETENLFPRIK